MISRRNVTRRALLAGSAAALAATRIRRAQAFAGNPFTLGVASGNPGPDSVILWTRLAPEPLSPDPDRPGGMPPDLVTVGWEVTLDQRLTQIVGRGEAIAMPDTVHAVHVECAGLQPGRDYWYRFIAVVSDGSEDMWKSCGFGGGSAREETNITRMCGSNRADGPANLSVAQPWRGLTACAIIPLKNPYRFSDLSSWSSSCTDFCCGRGCTVAFLVTRSIELKRCGPLSGPGDERTAKSERSRMPDHKFVYTVSGVTLSNAQQAKISEAIGLAVAQVLAGDAPGTVRTDALNINRIYGGKWIPVAEAEKIGVDKMLNDPASGAGPRAP